MLEELGSIGSNAKSKAHAGVKEHSPFAVNDAGNEDLPSLGTGNLPSDHLTPPETEASSEGDVVSSTAVPQNAVSVEDLRSAQAVKSEDASKTCGSADESLNEREVPSATPVNAGASLPRSTLRSDGTNPSEELPETHSRATSEDQDSFETVKTHLGRAGSTGQGLNVTVGVQAEVQASGQQRTSVVIPDSDSTRTVIEIPHSPNTSRKLTLPKITVQNPSDATDADVSSTSKISVSRQGSVTAPRSLQSATQRPEVRKSTSLRRSLGLYDNLNTQATNEEPNLPPVKKRKLYVRKARNAAARKVVLDITLGRELAKQTKPALRRLARGERVTFDDSSSFVSGANTERAAVSIT